MKIGELIGPDSVIAGLRVTNKAQLIDELARRSAAALSLDQRSIFDALRAREDLGSTGLGKGFALPHARIEGLSAPFALLARLSKPIDFAAIDERPVDLVVLLLTPANGANEHIATLATVSRAMRDEAFVKRLREASNAGQLHEVLASG